MIEGIILDASIWICVRIAQVLYRVDCWCHGKEQTDAKLMAWLEESKHKDDFFVRQFMHDLFDGKLKAS